jgi:hypothetical protein
VRYESEVKTNDTSERVAIVMITTAVIVAIMRALINVFCYPNKKERCLGKEGKGTEEGKLRN